MSGPTNQLARQPATFRGPDGGKTPEKTPEKVDLTGHFRREIDGQRFVNVSNGHSCFSSSGH
jgi:hypothetical protein